MTHRDDCIFCKIAQGEAPCYKLHEDDLTVTFLDIFPAAPGHLLIVPKAHFSDLFDADPVAVARVATHSVAVARALESVFKPDGLGVYQLNRAAAGQTVFHYHMHLIPRRVGDPAGIHAKAAGDPEQLAKQAALLTEAIAREMQ